MATIASIARQSAVSRSRLLSIASDQHKTFRLASNEPATVTLLKEFAGPTVVVATLIACLWAGGQQFSLRSIAAFLVVFLVADRVMSAPQSQLGPDGRHQVRPSLGLLLLEWCGVCALLALMSVAMPSNEALPRGPLIAWFFLTPAALLLSNFGVVQLAGRIMIRRPGMVRHIIIGATDVGLELAKRVEQRKGAEGFMGFFDFRDPSRLPQLAPGRWGGACNGVADFVRRHGVDSIYIALPMSSGPRMNELLRELRDTTASIYFVPNVLDYDLVQPRCTEIYGIPALAVCETPILGMCALRKRAMDIGLGALALLLAGPLMLAIAIAVKLSSKGPVLFRQRRYGLNGEEIHVYKFRTMTVCEDGAVVTQATRHDQRITPLGRLLRRTSLDELPQILNVLEGRMSLVGPRPHAVAHNEQYRKLISGYMIRHKVRPGITGWAQVNGLRGETETVEKMRARVEYDIDYLKNWTLWLDFRILARTILLLFRDVQAY